ncbi:MAG: CapA family protein [Oscillospiraceae bacterium]|nr:CapA family protein [Oscillospiraceae bacterium]
MKKRIVSILLIGLLLAACVPPPGDGFPALSPEPDASPAAPSSSSEPPSSSSPPAEPSASPEPVPPAFELEEYTGPLYHAFFHFLIAWPDVAYGNSYGRDLDRDCVTPAEFRRSLEEFYRNDFVLMNLNDYAGVGADGAVTRKPIMVPAGKKPLILSFDDINYYSKTLGLGVCDKVILDENGRLAMSTAMSDGTVRITYDNDVVPMLEAFCEEFPDFSPFGDKGLLSITGYDGILGYRTQRDSPNRESEIAAARPVVQALLDAGWYFGAHGYGHFDMERINLERVRTDTRRWREEVGPLVGDTQIYLFPYGSRTSWDDPRFLSLIDDGFPLLMGVGIAQAGHEPYIRLRERYFFMDRWFIDGTSLRQFPDRLAPLLDAETVYSPEERNGSSLAAPVTTGAVYRNDALVYRERFAVTVALGGDVMLAGGMGGLIGTHGPDAVISPELAGVFRSADIAMINLESAVSLLGEPWPGKDYTFRADPQILDFLLNDLSAEVVSLANNHTLDYGFEAFTDTMDRLDARGIGYVGGGRNLAEAMTPHVVEADGVSVAFLGASSVVPNTQWYARENSPGLLTAYDPSLIAGAVADASAAHDYVIVYMHWGREHETEPTAAQISTARRLIDAGADAVIGAHPHIVQSFEVYNGKPIAYSLGNFLMNNRYDHTAVARLHLLDGETVMEIIPCRTTGGVFNDLAPARQAQELREHWNDISPNGTIGEDWILR